MTPYAIPYLTLLPQWEACDTSLMPVCLSASHVAFASVRMEPQYMLLGHAAGIACRVPTFLPQPVRLAGPAHASVRQCGPSSVFRSAWKSSA